MVLPSAPGAHPDGDPFAELDALRDSNSLVGKMEQRALEEQRTAAPPPAPSTSQSGRPMEVVTLDDSDDEDQAPPPPRAQDRHSLASLLTSDAPVTASEVEDEPEEGEGFSTADEAGEHVEDDDEENQLDVTMIQEDEEDDDDDEDTEDDDDSVGVGGDEDLTRKASPKPFPFLLPSLPSLPTGTTTESASGSAVASTSAADPAAPVAPVKAPRERRAASPTPPPRAPYVPPPTVRLSIDLPQLTTDSDVPLYSVAELAKDAGFGPEPDAEKEDSASESEREKSKLVRAPEVVRTETGEVVPTPLAPVVAPPKKKRRKFVGRNEGYDSDDSFVDDSELAVFEPKYYHRPKRDGFFVCTGTLELISDSQPIVRGGRALGAKNKAKPKATVSTTAGPVVSTSKKTRPLPDDDDSEMPSVSSVPTFGSGAPPPMKKKKMASGAFSSQLQDELDMLKREAAKESFEPKNKFPPRLKALLVDVATRAHELNEYNDDFFGILPTIFPYNLFTLRKLVKREFHETHIKLLDEDQAALMDQMTQNINDAMPAQITEFDELHRFWEQGEVARKLEAKTTNNGEGGDDGALTPLPEEMDAMQGVVMGGPSVLGDAVPATPPVSTVMHPQEPKTKFRFNEELRGLLYEVVMTEDHKVDIILDKMTLEKSDAKAPSHLSSRKLIYAALIKLWPSGWMSTNWLSREMSAAKKRHDKELEKADGAA